MPVDPWKILDRFIDAVSLVTQEKHFKRSLQTLAHGLGFELYAYINIRSKSGFAISNYPKEWQDRYFRKSTKASTLSSKSRGERWPRLHGLWKIGNFSKATARVFQRST
jgi:hypothetical protein